MSRISSYGFYCWKLSRFVSLSPGSSLFQGGISISGSLHCKDPYLFLCFSYMCILMSQLMRLWYFSSSINSFFKRACTAIQWARCLIFGRDLSSTSILHVCEERRLWRDCAGRVCGKYHNLSLGVSFYCQEKL